VDRYYQVTMRMNHYSVPVRLIGRPDSGAVARLGTGELGRPREGARHERLATRGGVRLDLDHYLGRLSPMRASSRGLRSAGLR
jgi:hypothetical protein